MRSIARHISSFAALLLTPSALSRKLQHLHAELVLRWRYRHRPLTVITALVTVTLEYCLTASSGASALSLSVLADRTRPSCEPLTT